MNNREEYLRNQFRYIWFFPNNPSRFNPEKEILQQRTKDQIIKDIKESCTRLIARLQPTNNYKIGAVLILLQTIKDLAPAIATPTGVTFNYDSGKIQDLYIKKLDTLQTQLGSIKEKVFEGIPANEHIPLLPGKLPSISHNIIQALQNIYFEEGSSITIHEDEEIIAELSKKGARKHIKDQQIKKLIEKRSKQLIDEINNLKLEEEIEEIQEKKGYKKYKKRTNEQVEKD